MNTWIAYLFIIIYIYILHCKSYRYVQWLSTLFIHHFQQQRSWFPSHQWNQGVDVEGCWSSRPSVSWPFGMQPIGFLSGKLGLVTYGTYCKKTQIISQVFSNNFSASSVWGGVQVSKFQIHPWFNCKNILEKSMSRVWGQFALVWMQGWNSRALNAWRRNWSTNWCWLQPLDRFLQQWKSERFSLKNMIQSYLHYTHLYTHIYMLYLCTCCSIWAEGRWRCSTAGIKRSR